MQAAQRVVGIGRHQQRDGLAVGQDFSLPCGRRFGVERQERGARLGRGQHGDHHRRRPWQSERDDALRPRAQRRQLRGQRIRLHIERVIAHRLRLRAVVPYQRAGIRAEGDVLLELFDEAGWCGQVAEVLMQAVQQRVLFGGGHHADLRQQARRLVDQRAGGGPQAAAE